METISSVIALTLIVLAVIQAVFGFRFARVLWRYRPPEIEDEALPHVSILLSLRGADPFLAKGLGQLMKQDYPRYDLRIAIDHPDDPAAGVARDAMKSTKFPAVHLSQICDPSPHCSLKCAALAQLAGDLDEKTEVVVLADADLVSHAAWLRELIIPLLKDPKVGATYGNRWFWPEKAWWGSLVRYLWNVAAVVPMYFCKIPWGGTFAIRAKILRESRLSEKWSRAIVEDAPIRSALDELGLELKFVPSLMMMNREDCRLSFSVDFIKRQLTWTRLYHPDWWFVVCHSILTTAALIAGITLLPAGLISQDVATTAWAVAGIAIYFSIMAGLMALLERAVRRIAVARGEEISRFSPLIWMKAVLTIPLAQVVHMTAVLLAIFRKRVVWRGVSYQINGPWEIERMEYRPYRPKAPDRDQAPDIHESL